MKTKTIIIPLILALLILPIVLGADWTQYTSSPVSCDIEKVRVAGSYAMAYCPTGDHVLFYNGSSWKEVAKPSTSYDLQDFDKASNDEFYWYFASGSYSYEVYKYNTNNETWSLRESGSTSDTQLTGLNSFACIEEGNGYVGGSNDAECWIAQSNDKLKGVINGNDINITPPYTITKIQGGLRVWAFTTTYNYIYEYNGVSWQSRERADPTYSVFDEISSTEKVTAYAYYLRGYNISLGQFQNDLDISTCSGTGHTYHKVVAVAIHPTTTKVYFTLRDTYYNHYINTIYNTNYQPDTCNVDTNTPNIIRDIHFDKDTGNGWAVGANGIIYEYTGGAPPPPSSEYDLNIWIEPNPTIYGDAVEFHAKATHSQNKPSNITIYIYKDYNLTTLKKTVTQNNIPSGTDVTMYELTENSPFWTNYPPNQTYYYYGTAVTTDNTNATGSIIVEWNITGEATQNTTVYEATQFLEETPTGYQIYTITAQGEDHAYAGLTRTSDNKQHIMSFDSSNPTNIIGSLRNQSLTDDGGTNPNIITSMDVYYDNLYIGTNDELYIYTNATQQDAQKLTYLDDEELPGADGVIDLQVINDTKIWVGQNGGIFDDDDIYLYNQTDQTFTKKMNIDPLRSLEYYDESIIAHQGSNQEIEIWNTTTTTKTATINIGTISVYAYNDLTSINNNTLYAITRENQIKKYDITNRTNPEEKAKCETPQEEDIISIEEIQPDQIIIGTYDTNNGNTWLMICDFTNNETYNVAEDKYEAQILQNLLGRLPYEIEKMNEQGKFHTAEETHYGIYYYQKTIEEISVNNPPTINQVIATDTTPCQNQTIEFEIIASDPDNDIIRYESNCEGGSYNNNEWTTSNTFTCTYQTLGTKNINIWVKDEHDEITSKTTTINVQNCTAPHTLLFKVIDYDTGNPIQGATITIEEIGTKTTDMNGHADFTVPTNQEYQVTWTANEYETKTYNFQPSPLRYTIWLSKLTGNTVLIIQAQDQDNNPLGGSFVTVSNTITGQNKYGITDANGRITFTNMFTGEKLLISATNQEKGYKEPTYKYTSLTENEQKTTTITLTKEGVLGEEPQLVATNRGCIDTIPGVILCGDLSGQNNSCTQDTDCLSGRCMLALTTEARKCAKFNYTLCDAQGINRGNMCIFKNITAGILRMIGNLILQNFLYVLIILFLIITGLIIRHNLKQ